MSRVQALVPFPGLSRWRFASQLPEKGKGPSSSPPVGKRALSRVTPSATAQTCHALPWARVLSCARALSPHQAAGEMGADPRGEERKAKERLVSPPAFGESFFLLVCARMHAARAGRCETGCFAGHPPVALFFNLFGGLYTHHSSPPIPVPQGLVVKWGTGASGPSLGRALPGPFVRQPRDRGPLTPTKLNGFS